MGSELFLVNTSINMKRIAQCAFSFLYFTQFANNFDSNGILCDSIMRSLQSHKNNLDKSKQTTQFLSLIATKS